MSTVSTVMKDKALTLTPHAGFDYRCIDDFIAAYQSAPSAKTYTVDLRQLNHLDSSTLGMLLLMRKSVPQESTITLSNANAAVKKVLIMSRFDRKFKLE